MRPRTSRGMTRTITSFIPRRRASENGLSRAFSVVTERRRDVARAVFDDPCCRHSAHGFAISQRKNWKSSSGFPADRRARPLGGRDAYWSDPDWVDINEGMFQNARCHGTSTLPIPAVALDSGRRPSGCLAARREVRNEAAAGILHRGALGCVGAVEGRRTRDEHTLPWRGRRHPS
jgi:hypothetical protein